MTIRKRTFATMLGAVFALAAVPQAFAQSGAKAAEPQAMHGLIGQIIAKSGERDALIAILREGSAAMPGCLSYVIATDPADADAIWITEVWDSKQSHAASLKLPSVQAAIARARPLIARFGSYTQTAPVAGHGLAHNPVE